jgi:hypothetical protein
MTRTAFCRKCASTECLLAWKLGPGNQRPGEHEEGGRGWQDKSADGCRPHVVGWSNDFGDTRWGHAGAFMTKLSPINGATASAAIRGTGDHP